MYVKEEVLAMVLVTKLSYVLFRSTGKRVYNIAAITTMAQACAQAFKEKKLAVFKCRIKIKTLSRIFTHWLVQGVSYEQISNWHTTLQSDDNRQRVSFAWSVFLPFLSCLQFVLYYSIYCLLIYIWWLQQFAQRRNAVNHELRHLTCMTF